MKLRISHGNLCDFEIHSTFPFHCWQSKEKAAWHKNVAHSSAALIEARIAAFSWCF